MTSQSGQRQFTLHIAGALHIDEVGTVQGTYVPQASNPVTWQRSVGGVGGNAARAAQKILNELDRGKLCLHAAVGCDHTAQQLITAMEAQGFAVAMQKINGCSTGRYSAVINETGELVLGLADVQIAEQLRAAPIASILRQGGLDGLMLDANISQDCLHELVAVTAKLPIQLAALSVSPSKALKLLPIARQIPLLFCNRREATAMAISAGLLSGTDNGPTLALPQIMDMLIEMGFNDCVLTDGDKPLIIRHQGSCSLLPIPPVKMAQNVNGAGDALAGACFAAMIAGYSLPEAMECYGLAQAMSVLSGNSHLAL